MNEVRSSRWVGAFVTTMLSATLAVGCEVTNPGPVQDEFLSQEESREGFVNGAKERLSQSIGWMAYSTALVARELFPGGQVGSYGHDVNEQAGSHFWEASGPNGEYNDSQQARWVAEEAIRRFLEVGDVDPSLLFLAYNWAGYANRVLGENYCEAVIDGGPLEPGIAYFQRAEQHFTDALALAPTNNDKFAAYAGRAQVRVWLEDWTGAVADASQVPDNFELFLEMDISQGGSSAQRNHLYFAASSSPYRSYTVRFTFFDDYYAQSGDPRTPWIEYAKVSDRTCVGSLQGYGGVPCTRQWKYKSEDDDIRLSSGREMRLLEAEALLVQGDIAGALTRINAVRASITSDHTGQPLEPWTASTLDEVWTVLKRERGIELWLEARRMGDQRRWEGTPGSYELPNFEALSNLFIQFPRGREAEDGKPEPRLLCYNISNAERNSNPNIPDVS
ncbi:MAG: RagB/SusD family nutrient uptake outer membrane protein [Longimicrobiales bacterium]